MNSEPVCDFEKAFRLQETSMAVCGTCNGSGGIQMRDENGNVIAEMVCQGCAGTGESSQ